MDSRAEARSIKGHAATSGVDKWVMIQDNTFRNWVNEQLDPPRVEVTNFETDFDDGVKLCALISSLQGKDIKHNRNPKNHHQRLANVGVALAAIADDNIRLVNIGPEDIVNGNLKLILGLVWHLILRYQIGKSKAPTKKLMLAWLQAVIPECDITNFTSDWNDGVALHALIEFCQPGLCPEWRSLNRGDRLENCRKAMELAKKHFGIPLVVRPEDLSSSYLDELSGMTYLSYFMKVDSPGYNATLSLVRRLLKQGTVNNFTSDWSDGRLLCNLVTSVGGHVTGWPALTNESVENMQAGMNGAKGLGIEPLLSAKEMVDPEVDHIAIMAYSVYFKRFKPVKSSAEKLIFTSLPQNVSVGQEMPTQPGDDDDDTSHQDDTIETAYTSVQAGPFQPKQHGKKPKGSSELVSLSKVLLADRAQEDDIRKTVQDLRKTPDARQAWAAWFASVCQDVPQEWFREFQHETFIVSMRYLQQSSQQVPLQQPIWQPLPPKNQLPMLQPPNATAPAATWVGSSQPLQQQHLQLPLQHRSYTPTQDVQRFATITLGEMGTSTGNLRPKSAPPSSKIIQQALNVTMGSTASTLSPVLTSQYQPSSLPSSAQPQPEQ